MSVVIITGSAGLVGSEAVKFYCQKGYDVIGIDNNSRKEFFGNDACTNWKMVELKRSYINYKHFSIDIRNYGVISGIFKLYKEDIVLIIHAAAQPSHDWACTHPMIDFTINANGTLVLLENYKQYCPEAVCIFTSTNKVYGDLPNSLELIEDKTRFEFKGWHQWMHGIDETMAVDQTKHSLFGVSKLSADLMVQEYGRYFGLKTVCFRCGCITGPAHSGTKLHGFLSYLMKCCITGKKYFIYGYKGKQVRDNIHSYDLINAFNCFFNTPALPGEVYNMGGSRFSNVSILEAIDKCEEISAKKLDYEYVDKPRIGDHKWWISDVLKFKVHYPEWNYKYNIDKMLKEIYEGQKQHV